MHIPAHDARPHALHGVTFNSFVTSATGARELAAWRTDFPAGSVGQPHSMSREEVMLVLTGRLALTIDGTAVAASAGDAVLVPAGAELSVSNSSVEPASAWLVTSLGMTATMGTGDVIAPPWAQ